MSPESAEYECFYLDVGQGSSQAVLFPSGDAVVVDCGPRHSMSVVLSFLDKFLLGNIKLLILTHNDSDHIGAAAAVIEEYARRIEKIGLILDRQPEDVRYLQVIKELRDRKEYTGELVRLEVSKNEQVLYDKEGVCIKAIAPSVEQALTTQRPNAISGVIVVEYGSVRLVFSGDAPAETFSRIVSLHGSPLVCDILTIPHHGAGNGGQERNFFTKFVNTKVGIISVGTKNRNGHPQPSVVRTAVQCGTRIYCTQATERCSTDLEALRELSVKRTQPCASTSAPSYTSHGERSRNVGCMTTIVAGITRDDVAIYGTEDHEAFLATSRAKGVLVPLCMTNQNGR